MKPVFFLLLFCLLSLFSAGQAKAGLMIVDKDTAQAEKIFNFFAYKRDAVACKQVKAWASTSVAPLAQKYRILCNALKGDKAAARFGRNILEASGHSDKLFFRWFDTVVEGKSGFSNTVLERSSKLIEDATREDAALYLILTDLAGVMPTTELLLKLQDWNTKAQVQFRFVSEQKLNSIKSLIAGRQAIAEMDSNSLCEKATYLNGQNRAWRTASPLVLEAKRRGLSCGATIRNEEISKQTVSLSSETDARVCYNAKLYLNPESMAINSGGADKYLDYAIEMKRRKLFCSGKGAKTLEAAWLPIYSEKRLCFFATNEVKDNENLAKIWDNSEEYKPHVIEAKRRGLSCGVKDTKTTQVASTGETQKKEEQRLLNKHGGSDNSRLGESTELASRGDGFICERAKSYEVGQVWTKDDDLQDFVKEAKRRGLSCGVSEALKKTSTASSQEYGFMSGVDVRAQVKEFLASQGLSATPVIDDARQFRACNAELVFKPLFGNFRTMLIHCPDKDGWKIAIRNSLEPSSNPTKNSLSANVTADSALTAAQREAERLRQELAALKTEQHQEQQRIDSDTQIPLITILSSSSDDRRGSIAGRATDNMGIAEVRVDGAIVPLKSDGSFEWQGFVPSGGLSVVIEAIDTAGLSSMQQVRLERGQLNQSAGPSFARLDPFRGKTARKNKNALALVIGVADYKYTSDPALYADKDAEYFQDYAAIKLGVPDDNIFTITNTEADEVSIKKAVKSWLLRMSVKDETDVYVFFAGHGLASSDGSNMFLLPYDGDPELLEDSAIDRKQLFADIQAISPRSVTVFLDSCYSGGTRAGGTLVASLRPIAIRAKEQNVPDGFTILSAAKGDQTSQSLEEAKHGLFSYFLMRGLEGDADANNDNQITAGELHSFVTNKVERQSGFKQTPDLQGDAGRVLVRFQ
ncbi:hypothetical protein HIMB100_00019360 [SAR116 cluster alpha proteobacterium HIMB100]|nr:hypothetical protein HIMB100_00019360 [SAR116 cluster alpha proteobacterium HIMB100]